MKLKNLWIFSLLIVAICCTAPENTELLEKFRIPQQTPYDGLLVELYEMQAAALPFLIETLLNS